ncbi:MAG TPA: hypothetical protein VK176_05950, partial [Phycisphaerales bacterium]|nr:hypothetical protein [Phycisphaerales bacterium]
YLRGTWPIVFHSSLDRPAVAEIVDKCVLRVPESGVHPTAGRSKVGLGMPGSGGPNTHMADRRPGPGPRRRSAIAGKFPKGDAGIKG